MESPSLYTKTTRKKIRRLLLSFSNVSRGFFVSFFGLLVNYILLHYKSPVILDSYVYCISIINLLLAFTNWGGKEYAVRSLTDSPSRVHTTLGSIINSRLILFFLLFILLVSLPVLEGFKTFILVYLLFKTVNSVFESMIVLQKRFVLFLLIDFTLNAGFILVILLDNNAVDAGLFLLELVILECLRLIINIVVFGKGIPFRLSFREGFRILKESRQFFFVAIAGFICSRSDLYAVGLLLDKHSLSMYYILINLVILCQIGHTTFVSTFSANIYRYNQTSFKKFLSFSAQQGFLIAAMATAAVYFTGRYYYRIGLDPIFTSLVFLNILSFTFVLGQVYHFTRLNEQKIILRVIVVSGCVNVALSFLLTGPYGVKGAFISNTACMVCTFLLFKIYSFHVEKQTLSSGDK